MCVCAVHVWKIIKMKTERKDCGRQQKKEPNARRIMMQNKKTKRKTKRKIKNADNNLTV